MNRSFSAGKNVYKITGKQPVRRTGGVRPRGEMESDGGGVTDILQSHRLKKEKLVRKTGQGQREFIQTLWPDIVVGQGNSSAPELCNLNNSADIFNLI